jgi:hypothetical protein
MSSVFANRYPINIESFEGRTLDNKKCYYNVLDMNDSSDNIGIFFSDGKEFNTKIFLKKEMYPIKSKVNYRFPRNKGTLSDIQYNDSVLKYRKKEFTGVMSTNNVSVEVDVDSNLSDPTYYIIKDRDSSLGREKSLKKLECFFD